jgi:competence protein ComGC
MKKDSFNFITILIFLTGIGVLLYSVFLLLPNLGKQLTEAEQGGAIKHFYVAIVGVILMGIGSIEKTR